MVAELTPKQAGETNKRKLVTVRTIDAIEPIEGADAIELAVVEGWKVVVKKGEFKAGDRCVYFEIDSFLPTGNPAWQFLVDKSSREFEGVVGHRLRTIKLRGQISQGLVLKLDQVPAVTNFDRDFDQAELLGIKKWEAPLPAELAGQAEGLFPSFIRKTDQERCQNLVNDIFQYDEQRVLIDGLAPEQADQAAILGGRLAVEDGKVYSLRAAKADQDAEYEISLKVDGSSATYFHRNGEVGACSRNLQLKINEANAGNTFVKMLLESGLDKALPQLGNIAIQGELMGPSIQGNREQFKVFKYFIFDAQNLDTGEYLTAEQRYELVAKLKDLGVDMTNVDHVPVLHRQAKLKDLGLHSVKDLLAFAEGKSITHPVREGLVFKRLDGKFSFKAISNRFLEREKD